MGPASSGLACGLRVPGITEAGPAASVWSCGARRDDSQRWKPASPLSSAPDTQSRCQKSLTQRVAVLCTVGGSGLTVSVGLWG